MKNIIKLSIVVLLLINTGCMNYIENSKISNFTSPTLKSKPKLLYPKDALEQNYFGNTEVILSISKSGFVENVIISKTSGYNVLDSAALEYCKNMIFYPAQVNSNPINIKSKWEIKFKFSDIESSTQSYLKSIKQLYAKAEQTRVEERNEILNEILIKNGEFIESMWNGLNFNNTIKKVILPEISAEWKETWDGYPLSFLLYHDFIVRFPQYYDLITVKTELKNSLKSDIQYIRQSSTKEEELKREKENLLLKIKKFIEDKYPGFSMEDFGLGTNFS